MWTQNGELQLAVVLEYHVKRGPGPSVFLGPGTLKQPFHQSFGFSCWRSVGNENRNEPFGTPEFLGRFTSWGEPKLIIPISRTRSQVLTQRQIYSLPGGVPGEETELASDLLWLTLKELDPLPKNRLIQKKGSNSRRQLSLPPRSRPPSRTPARAPGTTKEERICSVVD